MGRWFNRDPIGEPGGLNLLSFVRNRPIDDYDIWGLNPFLQSVLKCAAGIVFQELKEAVDKKYLKSTVCTAISAQINISIPGWCEGDKFPHIYPFAVDEKTIMSQLAKCVFDFAAGKTLDKALEGIASDDMKKLIGKVLDLSGDEISKLMGNLKREPFVKATCKDKKTMSWTLTAKSSFELDGEVLNIGEEDIGSGICQGRHSSSACCTCQEVP